MGKITVTDRAGNTHSVDAQVGSSVMENIIDLDDSVDAVCGGACCCATCHCLIDPETAKKLPPKSDDELYLLEALESFDAERSRLSCQIAYTEELDGMALEVAPEE